MKKQRAKRGAGEKRKNCKCFECGKKLWTEDIWGGQVNKKMKMTDQIRDICDECKQIHGYITITDYKTGMWGKGT